MPLTRKQASDRLGIGIRRLRDLERLGQLRPRGKKGEVRVYSEAMLARYMAEHPKGKSSNGKTPARRNGSPLSEMFDGETAALIFEALTRRATKIEIVTQLRVHPDVVDDIAMRFEKMKREGDDGAPIIPCAKCKQNQARFCGGCS